MQPSGLPLSRTGPSFLPIFNRDCQNSPVRGTYQSFESQKTIKKEGLQLKAPATPLYPLSSSSEAESTYHRGSIDRTVGCSMDQSSRGTAKGKEKEVSEGGREMTLGSCEGSIYPIPLSHNSRVGPSRLHATPPPHPCSPSRIPRPSRGGPRSPYNIMNDLAAVSSHFQHALIQQLPKYSHTRTSAGNIPVTPSGSPSFRHGQKARPTHEVRSGTGPSTRPASPPSLTRTTAIPFQPARSTPGTHQPALHYAQVASAPRADPPKSKKRKIGHSPARYDADKNGSTPPTEAEDGISNKARLSSSERDAERRYLEVLRKMLFDEETVYTTRCNGTRQVDVTFKKLAVLQGAIAKIQDLEQQVRQLTLSLENHREWVLATQDLLEGFQAVLDEKNRED